MLEDLPLIDTPAPNVEPSKIPEANAVDENGTPIDNLDHLYDTFVNMEVRLPKGERESCTVKLSVCVSIATAKLLEHRIRILSLIL